MKNLLPLMLLLLPGSCIFHQSGRSTVFDAPYIDSIGCRAAQSRLAAVDETESNSLISQALSAPGDSLQAARQPEFFQSIEESYQRYLPLFSPVKATLRPEIRCSYDLIETFKLNVFDPQPFINAMLHAMSLTDLSTLDFAAEPNGSDTMLVYVALTKALAQEGTKWLSFSEGELTLSVTRHGAVLITPKP